MKNLLLLLCICISYTSYAQVAKPIREPSTTRYLKDMYQYIKDKARRNQYYMNEFIINTNSFSAKKNALNHKAYFFYYGLAGDGSPLLRLITLVQKTEKTESRIDFMYDQDGNLGYSFEKLTGSSLSYKEIQVFYEKELCINLIVDQEVVHRRDTAPYQNKIDEFKKVGKEVYKKFFEDQEGIKASDK